MFLTAVVSDCEPSVSCSAFESSFPFHPVEIFPVDIGIHTAPCLDVTFYLEVMKEGEEYYINLNLQIRFIKPGYKARNKSFEINLDKHNQ